MLSYLNRNLIGPILPFTLAFASLFLLFKLSFKPFKSLKKQIKCLTGNNKRESFKSACLALSGTLGVGNIAGVASAISVGGAGAIFWMWIFAFLAMVIKYAEVVLGMHYKHKGEGGAALYIKHGVGSKVGAVLFSVLVIIGSIGMGNFVQSSAAAESIQACFDVPKSLTGTIFAIITLLMITGGRKRITNASAYVIPILSVGYILISISIIIINRNSASYVLGAIFREAFDTHALIGGAGGYLISDAVRLGASRGILSNEAGCGTAPYAHNTSVMPAEQGIWGIFEVFVDTILLCTLTAFVILMTPMTMTDANGMKIALEAFGSYGSIIRDFIGVSSAIYALASVVCWSYYGVSALNFLGANKKTRVLYLVVYSIAGIIGAIFSPSIVWEISDLTVALMTIFNTFCVIKLWKKVKYETDLVF